MKIKQGDKLYKIKETIEKTVLIIVVILVVGLGIFPAPLMEVSNSAVESILANIN